MDVPLSGKFRIVIGEHDLILSPAKSPSPTRGVPHWLGTNGEVPAEVLSALRRQGERMQVGGAAKAGHRHDD